LPRPHPDPSHAPLQPARPRVSRPGRPWTVRDCLCSVGSGVRFFVAACLPSFFTTFFTFRTLSPPTILCLTKTKKKPTADALAFVGAARSLSRGLSGRGMSGLLVLPPAPALLAAAAPGQRQARPRLPPFQLEQVPAGPAARDQLIARLEAQAAAGSAVVTTPPPPMAHGQEEEEAGTAGAAAARERWIVPPWAAAAAAALAPSGGSPPSLGPPRQRPGLQGPRLDRRAPDAAPETFDGLDATAAKKLKRRMANRESARRVRARRAAENAAAADEVERLRAELPVLRARLARAQGPDTVAAAAAEAGARAHWRAAAADNETLRSAVAAARARLAAGAVERAALLPDAAPRMEGQCPAAAASLRAAAAVAAALGGCGGGGGGTAAARVGRPPPAVRTQASDRHDCGARGGAPASPFAGTAVQRAAEG